MDKEFLVLLNIVWDPQSGKVKVNCEGPNLPIHISNFKSLLDEVYRIINLQADDNGMLFTNKEKAEEDDIPLLARKVSNENIN